VLALAMELALGWWGWTRMMALMMDWRLKQVQVQGWQVMQGWRRPG
jgi:hypothetical protein